jgi:hypothetical protein
MRLTLCRGCKLPKKPWISFATHFYCKECIDAFKAEAEGPPDAAR